MIQCMKSQAEREKKLKELKEKIESERVVPSSKEDSSGYSDAEIEYCELSNSDWPDSRPVKPDKNPYKKGGHGRCQ